MTQTIYAIGDIHGQRAMLEDALARIDRDGGTAETLVFLGDYVDRGPDSRGVIDLFLRGLSEGRNWRFVKGNHDRMFQRFFEEGETGDPQIKSGKRWVHPSLGGDTTLESYDGLAGKLAEIGGVRGIDAYGFDPLPASKVHHMMAVVADSIPIAHRNFIRDLPLTQSFENLLFVHAGLRPGLPMKWQTEDDMLWIRDAFLEDTRQRGALVVHGHTPVDVPDLRLNRLNLDTGAGYGRALTAAVFDEDGIFVLSDNGREKISV